MDRNEIRNLIGICKSIGGLSHRHVYFKNIGCCRNLSFDTKYIKTHAEQEGENDAGVNAAVFHVPPFPYMSGSVNQHLYYEIKDHTDAET